MKLERVVFDSPEPASCQAAVDLAANMVRFECVGDLTGYSGSLSVDGDDLIIDRQPLPWAISAGEQLQERVSMPCNVRPMFRISGATRLALEPPR